MKPSPSRKLKALSEFGVVLALVALLIAAPACSFIEGLMGGDEGQADGGAVAQVDGSAAGTVPQPPPVVPPTGMPDAAAALAAAMKNVPDGGLPPGIDPSKLPPGIDPSKLPPGFDPSKLPPGIDPSKIPDGGLPPGIDPSQLPPGVDPSKLAGLDPSQLPPGVNPADLAAGKVPPGAGLPPGADPATLAALSKLTPEQRSQLQEAVHARAKLSNQIRRLNYIIDRNLTKNPADVVRLNRYVRAKREIDSRLNALRREHNIPEDVFRKMLKAPPPGGGSADSGDDDSGDDSGDSASAGSSEINPRELPYDFPAVRRISGKAGDHVIAPNPIHVKNAYANAGNAVFIFRGAKLLEPGSWQSKIEWTSGQPMIPNAFLIPIRSGETASVGDIVLTWAQTGTGGMSRAIIVEGGTPESPHARYLDYAFDGPTGDGAEEATLQPNTFHQLKAPWDAGQTVACKNSDYEHYQIIATSGAKALVNSASGHLAVFSKSACNPLPMRPEVKVGQKVWTTCTGGFCESTVTKVDPAIGRVWAWYDWVGTKTEVVPAFGEISLTKLD